MPTAIRVVTTTLVAVDTTETTMTASDRTVPHAGGGGDQRRPRASSSAVVATANDGPPSDEAVADDADTRRAVEGSSEPRRPQGDGVASPSSSSRRDDKHGEVSKCATRLPRVVEPVDTTPLQPIVERFSASPRKILIGGVISGREMCDTWDALVERESRYEASSVQRLIGPADLWREVHIASIHDIVDDYDIDPSMVGAAFALFDRYFMRGLVRGGEWSLALMTCLYLAIKIHSSHSNGEGMIDAVTMSWECGDRFTPGQIIDMERRVCRDLDWRLNPPRPELYVDLVATYLLLTADARAAANDDDDGYCNYLNPTTDEDYDIEDIPPEMRRELVRQSKLLCGMSVLDRNFAVARPSSIAHAAIAVAMDVMRFPARAIWWFSSLPLERDPGETEDYVARLHRLCSASGHAPAKVFDFNSSSPNNDRGASSGDDDDDDDDDGDTDTSSLTRSDIASSVAEGAGDVPTLAGGLGACREVGCEDAASAASSKRRRIR